MKKNYFLILLLFPIFVNSQIISFSDINLKNKLLQADVNSTIAFDANYNRIKIDINNDNEIEMNEALLVSALNVSNSNINNLSGLELFSNLFDLNCSHNSITSFNSELYPNLLYFSGNNNLLTSFSIDNNNIIEYINLTNNNLVNLSVTNCSNLWALNCSYNLLTNINILNLPTLDNIDIKNNLLTNINLSNFPSLLALYFDNNLLTNLTFNNCPNITQVQCSNNLLTALDFSNLNFLDIIYCFDNQLNSINLTGCSNLTRLFSSNNNLSSLDCSSCSSLDILDCQNNQLTYLNVKNGIHETTYGICGNPNLNYICVDNNQTEINHMTLQVEGTSFCGYSNVTIDPNCSLNTDSFDLTSNFELFPNPTQNILNINSSPFALINSIKIYNNIRQLVFTKTNDTKDDIIKLDVSLLNPGVYLTLIESDKGLFNKKFIKN